MCQSGFPHNSFFCMESLTNCMGPRLFLKVSEISPPVWGPTGEDLAAFRLALVGRKIAISW